MRRLAVLASIVLLTAACGGGKGGKGGGATSDDATASSAAASAVNGEALPPECVPTPYTVTAQRDGAQPAGAAAFEVVGAAGLPIPLVPDKAQALDPAQAMEQGASTDLLGYVVFFGDEAFGPADVSMFGGYEPSAEGASRGTISIFPATTAPLAVGDAITPGALDGLEMFTTLSRVTMDFKAGPDELTSYLESIAGQVTVLGLNASSICLDVDLTWQYTDGGPDALGTLTLKGIFTAPLAARTQPFT
jgi:hypothetical protein